MDMAEMDVYSTTARDVPNTIHIPIIYVTYCYHKLFMIVRLFPNDLFCERMAKIVVRILQMSFP